MVTLINKNEKNNRGKCLGVPVASCGPGKETGVQYIIFLAKLIYYFNDIKMIFNLLIITSNTL